MQTNARIISNMGTPNRQTNTTYRTYRNGKIHNRHPLGRQSGLCEHELNVSDSGSKIQLVIANKQY